MNLKCQKDSIMKLDDFASSNIHSLLICGPSGCGKTFLASYYASKIGIFDFQIVEPTVSAIRNAINICLNLNTPIVLCVENLDTGVLGASYSLLKFLEEPNPSVYIVVTARNESKVLDTIIGRSAVVDVMNPHPEDLDTVAVDKDASKYKKLKDRPIWRAVRTFKDIDTVYKLSESQIDYIQSLSSCMNFRDPVSTIVWNIGHYLDSTETPVSLVLQYLLSLTDDKHVRLAGNACITDLASGRLSQHAVLSQFVLECKYCE